MDPRRRRHRDNPNRAKVSFGPIDTRRHAVASKLLPKERLTAWIPLAKPNLTLTTSSQLHSNLPLLPFQPSHWNLHPAATPNLLLPPPPKALAEPKPALERREPSKRIHQQDTEESHQNRRENVPQTPSSPQIPKAGMFPGCYTGAKRFGGAKIRPDGVQDVVMPAARKENWDHRSQDAPWQHCQHQNDPTGLLHPPQNRGGMSSSTRSRALLGARALVLS